MKILPRLDDEVDVVVSGHTHKFTNALVPNQNGKKILLTQAWSAGRAYADIELEISRVTRDVVKKSAAIVTTWEDDKTAEVMRAAEKKLAPTIHREIVMAACGITNNQSRAGESALGNLIADALRQAMGSNFAFIHGKGIRADLEAGLVTWGDLYAVQPFDDHLVQMELSGQQIYDLLNQQSPPTQNMLQVSGLTYTWDANLPKGNRIVKVHQDGVLIDKTKSYTVTVNTYLSEGGDNFGVFKQGRNKKEGPKDLEALCNYIKSLPQPFSAKIEGRIEKLN